MWCDWCLMFGNVLIGGLCCVLFDCYVFVWFEMLMCDLFEVDGCVMGVCV